jgi:hypothetical protein
MQNTQRRGMRALSHMIQIGRARLDLGFNETVRDHGYLNWDGRTRSRHNP